MESWDHKVGGCSKSERTTNYPSILAPFVPSESAGGCSIPRTDLKLQNNNNNHKIKINKNPIFGPCPIHECCFLHLMASATQGKKLNKRPQSSNSDKPPKSKSKSKSSPMGPSRSAPPIYRKTSVVFSVLLILCVFGLLGVSSNMWRNLNSDAVSTPVYSIEVANEFPHDPAAFTQVALFGFGFSFSWKKFLFFLVNALNSIRWNCIWRRVFLLMQGLLYDGNGVLFESTGLYGRVGFWPPFKL